jgi:hypothetical protein
MTAGESTARSDSGAVERVRGILASLTKYIHAKTIYTPNNPNIANFASAFNDTLQDFFRNDSELVLSVEQYRILWNDEVVYTNPEKKDSIAFLLYKDGVGEITIHSTVTPSELDRFVDLLKTEIYTPSSAVDVVGRLWESELVGITYRVYDETAGEGTAGGGQGAGTESREKPLQAGDHPQLSEGDATSADSRAAASLAGYVTNLAERDLPNASAQQKEERLQSILESLFTSSTDDQTSLEAEHAGINDGNKLLRLLTTMLEFAQMRADPVVVRDVGDIIDRLVRYVVDEAHVPTLVELLEIQRTYCREKPFAPEFESLPARIEHEITNEAFLLSLGKTGGRNPERVQQVLKYFRLIGKNSVPGLCELLAALKEPSLHTEVCDTLIALAADEVPRVVNDLNLDNPHEAKDAVYLLQRSGSKELHPAALKLLASPDPRTRELVVEYLVQVGNDQAATAICGLLADDDPAVRIKTLAAIESFRHPMVVDKVTALCFGDDNDAKGTDELERLFRVVGKLAGKAALGPIRQMTGKGSWLPFAKGRGKHNKLLAVTALRYIPGTEALELLHRLAEDGDSLVRTKAAYALKHLDHLSGAEAEALTQASGKEETR